MQCGVARVRLFCMSANSVAASLSDHSSRPQLISMSTRRPARAITRHARVKGDADASTIRRRHACP
eukprot:9062109-Heterocapsa_arctica.AAC.1